MEILFCGLTFPMSPQMLQTLLPQDHVYNCHSAQVAREGLEADVIVPLMHRLETDLIQNTKARLIQQWGVGLEGVDIPEATRRGIAVCNVPGDVTANADSTAEHAVFLMLGIARRIHSCFRSFLDGEWGVPVGEALFGNTALIVGLGHVGKALARKLRGLGMNVEAVRRSSDPQTEDALGLVRTGQQSDLLEMASQADFVISTTVLTDQTRGMFNEEIFRAMKPTAFVINVSRGLWLMKTIYWRP